jgi:hypothetical protein
MSDRLRIPVTGQPLQMRARRTCRGDVLSCPAFFTLTRSPGARTHAHIARSRVGVPTPPRTGRPGGSCLGARGALPGLPFACGTWSRYPVARWGDRPRKSRSALENKFRTRVQQPTNQPSCHRSIRTGQTGSHNPERVGRRDVRKYIQSLHSFESTVAGWVNQYNNPSHLLARYSHRHPTQLGSCYRPGTQPPTNGSRHDPGPLPPGGPPQGSARGVAWVRPPGWRPQSRPGTQAQVRSRARGTSPGEQRRGAGPGPGVHPRRVGTRPREAAPGCGARPRFRPSQTGSVSGRVRAPHTAALVPRSGGRPSPGHTRRLISDWAAVTASPSDGRRNRQNDVR